MHLIKQTAYEELPRELREVMPKSFNELPKGMKEISAEEFAKSHFLSYPIVATGYRQLKLRPDSRMIGVRLFWNNLNEGYGMAPSEYRRSIRYFRFGCEHEFTVEYLGSCRHLQTCKHCGMKWEVDSSG